MIPDIYQTHYESIIFEWTIHEEVFSLDIINGFVGYFIESKGIDIKQVDKIPFNSTEWVVDLTNFLIRSE